MQPKSEQVFGKKGLLMHTLKYDYKENRAYFKRQRILYLVLSLILGFISFIIYFIKNCV